MTTPNKTALKAAKKLTRAIYDAIKIQRVEFLEEDILEIVTRHLSAREDKVKRVLETTITLLKTLNFNRVVSEGQIEPVLAAITELMKELEK